MIIRVDNYDREGPDGDERVIASGITDERLGKLMLDALQDDSERPDRDWYRLVPDDHVLREFIP